MGNSVPHFFDLSSEHVQEVKYPDYYLGKNPFPSKEDLTEGSGEGEDFSALFGGQIHQKEIHRIIDQILDGNKQGKKKFWIIKNDKLIPDHNISAITGLFRMLTISTSPRIFPVYVPFPVIEREPLAGILKWCADRLTVEKFRFCVYAFIRNELKKMQDSGEASEKLPSFEVAELIQKMDETEGQNIDDILFIEEPREVEVELEVEVAAEEEEEESQGEQAPDQPEAAAPEPTAEEIEAMEAKKKELEEKQRLRNEFILGIESKIASSSFSPQVKSALAVAITQGYEKGRSYIGVGEYRQTLKGLLSLIALFHEKAVVILDRIDNWDMMDDAQQAAMMGTLTELDWLFGQVGILTMASYERTIDMIGGDFAAMFSKIPLDMWPVTLDLEAPLSSEDAVKLTEYFLGSDKKRRTQSKELESKELEQTYPFIRDGIDQVLQQVNGHIGDYLVEAGRLLDVAWAEQHVSIDVDFVKSHGLVGT